MKDFKAYFGSIKNNLTVDKSQSGIVAGMESSNATVRGDAESKLSMLNTNVMDALSKATMNDDGNVEVVIGAHQIKAATEAAKYAINPLASVTAFAKGRAEAATQSDSTHFDKSLTPMDKITDAEVLAGLESFEKVDTAASLYFTVAYQSLALVQDPVAELFYPIVVVDPSKNGFTVQATITNIVTTVKRDLSGKAVKNIRESIFKKLNDTALFTLDANRLYPVIRDENADILYNPTGVTGVAKTVTIGDGYEIETAPIKTNVEANILTLSQPDDLVAKGLIDDTDMLNTHLSIDTLLFTVTGNDTDGNSVTENFLRPVHGLPAVFTGTKTGSTHDLELNYNTTVTFRGGALLKADGSESAIVKFESLTAGHYVNVDVSLKGDSNVESANFIVYPVKVVLSGLFDAAGNEITSGTEYDDVKSVIDTIKLPAVYAEAYAQNSNGRFRARTLSTETKEYVYTLQRRHVIREVAPVSGVGGNDVGQAMVDFTTQALSKNGLLELVTSSAIIESLDINTQDFGMASDLFFRTFYKESFDVATIVDGRESGKREIDIAGALKLKIKNYARKMYVESNYSKVFRSVYKGAKPTVIIGTDFDIGTYVESFEDDMFNYVVRRTDDELIQGTLYMSFGVMGKQRNAEPTVFNYGVCGWSPETVLASQRDIGGVITYETLHMPVYRHQTLMPIITVLEISGMESVSGKLTTYTKAV